MICVVMALCILCSMVASAETEIAPRGNSHIAAHSAFLYMATGNMLQVWFDVTANAMVIDRIGVMWIEIYRSSDQTNWTKMRTYEYTEYPDMMGYNKTFHAGHVTYGYATPGYYYKAYITFYAASSTGSGAVLRYTAVLQS